MRIAHRVRMIRLERSRSIESVEGQAGLAKGLLARLESGQQAPSMENLQRLALVLGVSVHRFFFADGETISTPYLTPRPSLDDLARLHAPRANRGRHT